MIGKSTGAFAVFLFFALTCLPASQQSPRFPPVDKLEIAIYYETLCPDSKRLLTQQVPHVIASFAPYVTFKFFPFGLSTTKTMPDGSIEFTCQHGPIECEANKIHSIALFFISEPLQQAEFLSCVMNSTDPTLLLQKCIEPYGLHYDDVIHYYGTRGAQSLQLLAQAETNKVQNPLAFVPTIVYNNAFSQDLQDQSVADLEATVCSLVPGICAL